MDNPDVVIVGAGLAGLCCALRLKEGGVSPLVLEASDGVGGRVWTDVVDGHRLDRGFQVLLTCYPEANRWLDFEALRLGTFLPGALVRFSGRFYEVADPFRRFWPALRGLANPVGSVRDKLRMAGLRRRLVRASVEEIFEKPEMHTRAALEEEGFSDRMIERFFRPFLGGVLLDPDLLTSSRMYEYLFRMFARGEAGLPDEGMGAIGEQLAGRLSWDRIRLGARVAKLEEGKVRLESGEEMGAKAVVVATEGPEAARLTGAFPAPQSRPATCVYYSAETPPVEGPMLVLNGNNRWPVNNLCVPSQVSEGYAPKGRSLVSVTVLGKPDPEDLRLDQAIRRQVKRWFGREVNEWRLLRVYRIEHAQPDQRPPALEPPIRPARVRPGLYVCGDHRANGSINGAMLSGRLAAEALLENYG